MITLVFSAINLFLASANAFESCVGVSANPFKELETIDLELPKLSLKNTASTKTRDGKHIFLISFDPSNLVYILEIAPIVHEEVDWSKEVRAETDKSTKKITVFDAKMNLFLKCN